MSWEDLDPADIAGYNDALHEVTLKRTKSGQSEIQTAIRKAAIYIEHRTRGAVSFDDAYQDIMLFLATHPRGAEAMKKLASKGKMTQASYLMFSRVQNDRHRAQRSASFKRSNDRSTGVDECEFFDLKIDGYNEETIREALILHYDPSQVSSYQQGVPEEEGMPRAAANPSHKNTAWAVLADIDRAFERADLSPVEYKALFYVHACGWTTRDAGDAMKVSHVHARKAANSGLGKIMEAMQGKGNE